MSSDDFLFLAEICMSLLVLDDRKFYAIVRLTENFLQIHSVSFILLLTERSLVSSHTLSKGGITRHRHQFMREFFKIFSVRP